MCEYKYVRLIFFLQLPSLFSTHWEMQCNYGVSVQFWVDVVPSRFNKWRPKMVDKYDSRLVYAITVFPVGMQNTWLKVMVDNGKLTFDEEGWYPVTEAELKCGIIDGRVGPSSSQLAIGNYRLVNLRMSITRCILCSIYFYIRWHDVIWGKYRPAPIAWKSIVGPFPWQPSRV